MKFVLKLSGLLVLPVLLALTQKSFAGHFQTYDQSGYEPSANVSPSWSEEDRTANRTPSGALVYPHWILDRPEHYEFSPSVSNWDAQNKHPQQWKGQDWDPSKWNKHWTPGSTVQKFYEGRIFDRQYIRDGHMPVLMLGPRFYVLSDLDQRRTLKLLSDYTGIFNNKGYTMIELRDWHTKGVVGAYTPQGMYLN